MIFSTNTTKNFTLQEKSRFQLTIDGHVEEDNKN